MLDIKFLRENPEIVKQNIRNKFQDSKLPLVDEVIALDAESRKTQQEADNLRAERKKISKEIENLSKKNSGSGKPTKAQEANNVMAQEMLDWMEADHPYTISELSKECPAVLGATPQKIRPLLTGLIKANAVERTEGKGGKPIFTKVVED